MSQIEIAFLLPYFLLLKSGKYPLGSDGKDRPLLLQDVNAGNSHAFPKRTQVSLWFEGSAVSDDDIQRLKSSQIEKLLQQTNRLLRWYRVGTGSGAITEVTRVQASPFIFRSGDESIPSLWLEEVSFEPSPLPLNDGITVQSITRTVKKGLAGKNDPEVSRLFLLDAEQALREGRFRESVLFCWSTIDATFNTKYEQIVDQALIGEWAEGRNWLKDNRFGMKHKMSAALFLLTGQSLARGTGDLWVSLGQSYKKRNSIIHSGETAQEADAELALSVAKQVVALMATLKPKKAAKK